MNVFWRIRAGNDAAQQDVFLLDSHFGRKIEIDEHEGPYQELANVEKREPIRGESQTNVMLIFE